MRKNENEVDRTRIKNVFTKNQVKMKIEKRLVNQSNQTANIAEIKPETALLTAVTGVMKPLTFDQIKV